jgi:NTP pyrophosphatase (non-canonical NTP hydrolase)
MTEQEIFKKAIEQWGETLQLVMSLEETAELQKEVCKVIRGDRSNIRMDKLAEEIADVEITTRQLKWMFDLGEAVIMQTEYKLRRIEGMLK